MGEQHDQYDSISPAVVDGIRAEMFRNEDVFVMG
jgi:hypothetical protein